MASSYTSFLIRHWSLTEGGRRVTIEHIQTGEAIAVATLDEALAWLGRRATAGAADATRGVGGEGGAPVGGGMPPPDVAP